MSVGWISVNTSIAISLKEGHNAYSKCQPCHIITTWPRTSLKALPLPLLC